MTGKEEEEEAGVPHVNRDSSSGRSRSFCSAALVSNCFQHSYRSFSTDEARPLPSYWSLPTGGMYGSLRNKCIRTDTYVRRLTRVPTANTERAPHVYMYVIRECTGGVRRRRLFPECRDRGRMRGDVDGLTSRPLPFLFVWETNLSKGCVLWETTRRRSHSGLDVVRQSTRRTRRRPAGLCLSSRQYDPQGRESEWKELARSPYSRQAPKRRYWLRRNLPRQRETLAA